MAISDSGDDSAKRSFSSKIDKSLDKKRKSSKILKELEDDDEVYIFECPASLHPESNTDFTLYEDNEIEDPITQQIFKIKVTNEAKTIQLAIPKDGGSKLKNIAVVGVITTDRKLRIKKQKVAPDDTDAVPYPANLPTRHPLLGISAVMDSFMSNAGGPDSLSLQEMLDMDIKSEKDFDEIFGIDTNLNFHELPALNLDEDSLGAPGDNNVWLTSSNDGSMLLGGDVSTMSADLNVGETRMVCPNSVMPVTLIQVPYDKNAAKPKVSLLMPNNAKIAKTMQIITPSPESVNFYHSEIDIKQEYVSDEEDEDAEMEVYSPSVVFRNNQNVRNKTRVHEPTVRAISNGVKRNITLKSTSTKRRLQELSAADELNLISSAYPKPAYSYSCLIAMALKNSPSGSLPVSEIYNFMCEHFPYFKTAPNGWKNSVRHNLSLNKCFEKIEKPATNGSQRKGCLWAMNPNKINKMDEEVQKWSKKDKSAIRKSMICPETLDALERGQLSGALRGVSEMESDDEGWEHDASGRTWIKQEVVTEEEDEDDEDEDEEEEEEEEEVDSKEWVTRLPAHLSPDLLSAFPASGDDCDSDISLTDFDIEVAESICNEAEQAAGKLNVRVNGAFQPLLSGAYTVNSQGATDTSPKRFKTIGGSTITGNYVYKPLGTSSVRRKSPIRHSLLSSLEADD